MIKFPTEYGIGELRGDQVAARECYIAMLEMEDHQQTMCIGEQRTIAEPVEELKEVMLDESRPGRTTRMGTLARPTVRQDLANFLRMNQDIFAWSHEDMPGIDPSVIVHRLNVNPTLRQSDRRSGCSRKNEIKQWQKRLESCWRRVSSEKYTTLTS